MLRLGIVGHRYFDNNEATAFVAEQCSAILKQAKSESDNVVALSAIAEGADTLFAEAALALNIPLEIIRPFNDYVTDFENAGTRGRYERLRAAARSEAKLTHRLRSPAAYEAAMNWIVRRCNVVVFAWNGLVAEGAGGTGNAVKQAVLLNRPWLHLDVTKLSVTFHAPRLGGQ